MAVFIGLAKHFSDNLKVSIALPAKDRQIPLQRLQLCFRHKLLEHTRLFIHVRRLQCGIISPFSFIRPLEVHHRIAIAEQIQVHQKARSATVPINERMDAHQFIMKIRCSQHRMALLLLHFPEAQHKIFHLLAYQVRLRRCMPTARYQNRNRAVTSCILPVDAMQHKCMYLVNCTFAYLYATSCKILNLI